MKNFKPMTETLVMPFAEKRISDDEKTFAPKIQSSGLEEVSKIQFTIEMYSLINEKRASISNVIGSKSIAKRTQLYAK